MKATAKKSVLALLLVLAGFGASARDTDTQKLVSAYARKEPLRSGILGAFAMRGADTLVSYNRSVKMVPASNTKLLTTGLALKQLGPQMRFSTLLAYSGTLQDGVIDGDLYIIGGGDPTTGSSSECADSLGITFSRWKAILDAKGIKAIRGKVIGDARFFKRPGQGAFWQFEDLGFYYGAGPSGLNFQENSQSFIVRAAEPGAAPEITSLYPDTPWMNYVNSAVTGPEDSSNTIYYVNTEFGPFGEFMGSFPSGRRDYRLDCSNAFGAYTCAYFFHNYLLCNGIKVEGGFADISPNGTVRSDLLFANIGEAAASWQNLVELGRCESPELWRIVRDTNVESDNFYAETLFTMLSRSLYGSTDKDSAAIACRSLLAGMGLKTDNAYRQIDGSGLSRKNYVSPEFFVNYLRKMYAGPVRDYFVQSLPTPGGKGTLKNRMGKAPAALKSRIRMKSGSMNGVLCFSGYVLPADGDRSKTIFFSILTNNVTAPSYAVGSILDEIIVSLALEP